MDRSILLSAIGLAAGPLAVTSVAQSAAAQQVVSTAPDAGEASPAPAGDGLRRSKALLMLDYQAIKVPGDAPIDLMGLHLHNEVREGVYLGVGVHAPHFKGEYGGFMAFDVGAHLRYRLGGAWLATVDLSGGGGGGGRSVSQSKLLSGTGGFVKASVGLAYDLGAYQVGIGATRMRFRRSLIDSTQASLFVTVPYTYLSGAYSRHGEPLSPAEDRRAAAEMGENTVSVTLDNFRQIDPQGSFRGVVRTADLQYSHYFSRDAYWFAALGVGYSGLPIYNQMLGGVGRRWRPSRQVSLYGQLGVGSGGYAPSLIDTGPGLLVYPKVALEYALTRSLGLQLSVGYLSAPKASSRNQTYGLALSQHLRSGTRQGGADTGEPARWRGFRVSVFQQTEFNLVYNGIERDRLQLVGVQVDSPLGGPWYLPVQAAVAYSAYLGYPGYGELLAGLGLQTAMGPQGRVQAFGQLMGGANVHGLGYKLAGGLRYLLDERLSLHLSAGHIETRKSNGRRFAADSLAVGLDYRFSVPIR